MPPPPTPAAILEQKLWKLEREKRAMQTKIGVLQSHMKEQAKTITGMNEMLGAVVTATEAMRKPSSHNAGPVHLCFCDVCSLRFKVRSLVGQMEEWRQTEEGFESLLKFDDQFHHCKELCATAGPGSLAFVNRMDGVQ